MPNKAYAILYYEESEDIGHFYFPIKHANAADYADMPQFFGGTKNANESDLQTIAREAAEESNNQVTITALGQRIHSHTTPGGSQYNFYLVTQFTGNHFVGPLPGNNEMQSIERYQVHAGEEDGIGDFFEHLGITMSQDFAESETYSAFEAALTWGQQE